MFIFHFTVSYCSFIQFNDDMLVNRALQKCSMFENGNNNWNKNNFIGLGLCNLIKFSAG